jgi:hypothetical protein
MDTATIPVNNAKALQCITAQWVISLNLVLAGLRLGLKNRQVGEKWVSDDCSYLCKGLYIKDWQK